MKASLPRLAGTFLPVLAISLIASVPASAQVSTSGNELRFNPQVVTPTKKLDQPDLGKMISILKGTSEEGTKPAEAKPTGAKPAEVRPAAVKDGAIKPGALPSPAIRQGLVIERKTTIAPQALPKGFQPVPAGTTMEIKKGKTPATGDQDPGPGEGLSTTTLFMKKGNTAAEGRGETPPAPPYPTRMKDARTPAGGTGPTPGTLARPPAPQLPGHASGGYHPVAAAHAAAPATELSYRVDSSSQLSTNTVKFLKNSTELADQASYDYLFTLASALQSPELAASRFVVEGHASAEGSEQANLLLSQRRANAIFDFLVSRGVSPVRLLAVGHGKTHARFAANEPEYLRAQDRQVIVFKLAE